MKNLDLDSFVGKHVLSGVDETSEDVETYEGSGYYERASGLLIVLDNCTYAIVEDPSDGYRSYLGRFVHSKTKVKNKFEPHEVLAIKRPNSDYNDNDILDFYDTTTGKLVLSIGTARTYDYYPSFVGFFDPTALAINSHAEDKP